jgi:hypothetical protein
LSKYKRHTSTDKVGQDLATWRGNNGAGWHPKNRVVTLSAMAVISGTWSATRGLLVWSVVELKQGGDLRFNFQNNIATLTAIATVRAAKGLELLTQNRCAANATIARLRV